MASCIILLKEMFVNHWKKNSLLNLFLCNLLHHLISSHAKITLKNFIMRKTFYAEVISMLNGTTF